MARIKHSATIHQIADSIRKLASRDTTICWFTIPNPSNRDRRIEDNRHRCFLSFGNKERKQCAFIIDEKNKTNITVLFAAISNDPWYASNQDALELGTFLDGSRFTDKDTLINLLNKSTSVKEAILSIKKLEKSKN